MHFCPHESSDAVATMLLELGCKPGDRVMIAYPFGLDFLCGMLGAMKVGIIPCSVYPPNPKKLKREMEIFSRFAEDAGAKFALTTKRFEKIMMAARVLRNKKSGVKWLGTDGLDASKISKRLVLQIASHVADTEDIAFMQYTSGSTGRPKGIEISHRSILDNCREITTLFKADASTTGVMWIPQYHDMGLIGGFMAHVHTGIHLVATSPFDFLANPLLWDTMVVKYKAHYTCGPNFAYALLMKRLKQANKCTDWSHVKYAAVGGEPTTKLVVEAMISELNMKPGSIFNSYGLAEVGVLVTAAAAEVDNESGLVACGPAESHHVSIRIVDSSKIAIEKGNVGIIMVQTRRIASGYYGQDELTKATFQNVLADEDGFWLDTGDLGKIVDGVLFVTGREKDVIIIGGKNFYPTDIEATIDFQLGETTVRPGRTCAFQVGDSSIGITIEFELCY